ncbi:MAG: 4-hydroxy-tetrahydrodipicolinate synthase [Acidobacteriota bacterium]|nr:4-hydroxy-tetrahydrodipicolinate synthase [Acidobacteriota bacterium]
MLTGAFTLLMTPFDENFRLDESGLRTLVRMQVEAGIHGIAPLGVTGESPAMDDREYRRVVEICVEEAGGKCRVAPDTCACNIDIAVARVKMFGELGCDYAVVFAPFLVKPTQAGLVDFYRRIADASPIPILLHNVPERAAVAIEPKSYAKLIGSGNVVGTKDGVKDLDHLARLLHMAGGRDFAVMTAKDATAFPLMAFGGQGVFTVAGNILPGVMKSIVDLSLAGDLAAARAIHEKYYDLFEALRLETNPMAVKEALTLLGLPGGPLRPPLMRLSEANRETLKRLLKETGVL